MLVIIREIAARQGRGAGDDPLRRDDRRVRPRRRRGDDRSDLRRPGGLPAAADRRGARAPGRLAGARSLSATSPVERQAALSHQLALAVGHDPDHFRIDQAPHPFSVPHSPGDVRFTTRYDVANVHFSIHGHPARGRARDVRVQPAPRDFAFRPGGQARGMTVHESQSLSLEMIAGRSREFLELPCAADGRDLRRRSGPLVASPTSLNAWRRLDDGYIRVEADEISYPLHVILRYRLEQAMLKGDLAVGDIPGAWDELFTKLLGRTPPTDSPGLPAGHPLGRGTGRLLPQLRHGLGAGRAAVRARQRRRSGHPARPRPRRLRALLRLGHAPGCTSAPA